MGKTIKCILSQEQFQGTLFHDVYVNKLEYITRTMMPRECWNKSIGVETFINYKFFTKL